MSSDPHVEPATTTNDLDIALRLLRSLAAMCPPPGNKIWPIGEDGRMTFLKIPDSVDLTNRKQQNGLYGGPSSIASLPPELQSSILILLPAIDRICLALTCKSLAAASISSPHLRTGPWTPWLYYTEDRFPSRDALIKRLAHGWTDKSRLRYCQSCKRILPRDPEYFRQRLGKRKKLPYNVKTCMEQDKWKKTSNKKQYEHIIKLWSESNREDGSAFACAPCLTRELELESSFNRDLEKGRIRDRAGKLIDKTPVECPCCIVKSLTETYKEPRKPKIRPKLWKWTKKIFGFVGNTILVFLYLLYLLFKVPVDVGMWLFKKYRTSNFRFKRTMCMT